MSVIWTLNYIRVSARASIWWRLQWVCTTLSQLVYFLKGLRSHTDFRWVYLSVVYIEIIVSNLEFKTSKKKLRSANNWLLASEISFRLYKKQRNMKMVIWKGGIWIALLTILFVELLKLHLISTNPALHHWSPHTCKIIRFTGVRRWLVSKKSTLWANTIFSYMCRVGAVFHIECLFCRCWFLRSLRLGPARF